MNTLEELVEMTKKGDVFSAAKLITLIQRKDEEAEKLVSELPPPAKSTLLVGITGPGGVGKSTLINKLIHFFRKEGKTIGVMCCDPVSISGGAFLGDRVRMQEHSGIEGVFIRSLAQHENVKGVAPEVPYVVKIFGALKKEVIIIETVGSGQENLGFKDQVEILVFVSAPGFGDEIQLLKGGVIETADIIVLNKADRQDAELSFTYLQRNFGDKKIFKTNSENGDGIPELIEGIKELKNPLKGGEGLNFELSEEHKMIQTLMRDFVEKEVRPKVKEVDEKGEFPRELVKKLGELGFMGIFVPEKYGGMGMDILAYAIAEEELARVWPALGLIMSANNSLSIYPILEFGTEEQKQKYLVPLAKGQNLGCLALTEPEAGSDLASVKTVAKKEGEFWRITGTKSLITNASEAQTCVLLARTGEDKHKGLTMFIVELPAVGFSAKVEKKMGLHSSPTCEITLSDCLVPDKNILGEVGGGFAIAIKTLDAGRINIAAQALGTAQGAFDLAWTYVQERKQFGKPLINLQSVQFDLAEMVMKIEAARLLTYKAAWLKDQKQSFVQLASMAKLFASEVAEAVASKSFHLHGGYGFLKDFEIERYYRDAPIMQIYEGTSEVQKMTIIRALLGKYK